MVDEQIKKIKEIRDYAEKENIPIMQPTGIKFMQEFINKKNIKSILEIGSAIGYSAIMMALTSKDITITTIERDEARYLEAVKNIKKFKLEDRITIIYKDALEVDINSKYDLIFIDAAKGQNKKFFEKFSKNLNSDGYIITDNINFHGFVGHKDQVRNRNLRQLVGKIEKYIEFLKENETYHTDFYDVGDGVAVTYKQ